MYKKVIKSKLAFVKGIVGLEVNSCVFYVRLDLRLGGFSYGGHMVTRKYINTRNEQRYCAQCSKRGYS